MLKLHYFGIRNGRGNDILYQFLCQWCFFLFIRSIIPTKQWRAITIKHCVMFISVVPTKKTSRDLERNWYFHDIPFIKPQRIMYKKQYVKFIENKRWSILVFSKNLRKDKLVKLNVRVTFSRQVYNTLISVKRKVHKQAATMLGQHCNPSLGAFPLWSHKA